MASTIAHFYPSKAYVKPLNPVLGETFQGQAADGAMLYMEQTCHHPPVTHLLLEGPNGAYTVTGWSSYTVHAGMTSSNILAQGHKKVVFHDG